MATLHFLSGKAGAGKTTLARKIARETPAVLICEDEWISRIADPITKPEGLFFGIVTEAQVEEVNRYFSPPGDDERFNVVTYDV